MTLSKIYIKISPFWHKEIIKDTFRKRNTFPAVRQNFFIVPDFHPADDEITKRGAGFNPSAAARTAKELLSDFDWDKVPAEDIRIPEGLF